VAALVTVTGQGGTDTVTLVDRADTSGLAYRVTNNKVATALGPVTRAFAGLSYSGIDNLNLFTRNQGSQTDVDSTVGGTTLSVSGGSSGDVVYVGAGDLDDVRGAVNVYGNGGFDAVKVVDYSVGYGDASTLTADAFGCTLDRIIFGGLTCATTVERMDVLAEQGNNRFEIDGLPSATAVTLHGNGGTDELDYSGLDNGSGVMVDLAAGTATGLALVTGFENVTGTKSGDLIRSDGGANVLDGGYGHDMMFGRDGADALYGRAGRDILFGGAGADVLSGGHGDDILGSNTTTYETNLAALDAIQTECAYGGAKVRRTTVQPCDAGRWGHPSP
jgi:Ca2+-binding RTX toxin-like protein